MSPPPLLKSGATEKEQSKSNQDPRLSYRKFFQNSSPKPLHIDGGPQIGVCAHVCVCMLMGMVWEVLSKSIL